MNPNRLRLLFIALLTALPLQLFADPLSVAVLDFQTTGDALGGKGAEAAVQLSARLSARTSLILVERQELEKLLGEQELGLSGTVDPATAAKVGALTGAKVLVTGRLFASGEKYYLVAKIMGTETSRVFGEAAFFPDLEALDKAVEELAPKIAAVIEKRSGELVARVEDPAARLARLKQLLAGKPLPTVSVSISEEHIGRRVSDPAAETEVQLILQQTGFGLIDPKSGHNADVAVTGEAFSEFGARRGNLISCRARVEVKVTDRRTGELLLADRQTDVAVDLAEHIAAKKALENAAAKLVDRIVQRLAGE